MIMIFKRGRDYTEKIDTQVCVGNTTKVKKKRASCSKKRIFKTQVQNNLKQRRNRNYSKRTTCLNHVLCNGMKIKMECEKIKELKVNIQELQEHVGQNQSNA